MIHNLLAWLAWDPQRVAFTVPLINRPVMWYGIFFVTGFLLGYFLIIPMLQQVLSNRPSAKKSSQMLAEKLVWYCIIGTIVGARLGEVFFYDWPRYQDNLWDIVKIWEGGLASHGGTVGVFIALYFYQRSIKKQFPELTFITILDMIVVPTALTAFFIRIGNFFNQEILGNITSLPWAIIFGHPADGSFPAPRHPAQLYEAFAYLTLFVTLTILWKKKIQYTFPGFLSGFFFIWVFGSRLIIEFWKAPLSLVIDESAFHMGQYLSIPFIFLGVGLLFYSYKKKSGFRTI